MYANIIHRACCQANHIEKGLVAQVKMTTNRMFLLHFQNDIQKISLSKCQIHLGCGISFMAS